jgi:hypothetical protein
MKAVFWSATFGLLNAIRLYIKVKIEDLSNDRFDTGAASAREGDVEMRI